MNVSIVTERGANGFGSTGIIMTAEQKQTPAQQRRLAEFDDAERILQKHLKELHERRREYINTNQLNEKVGGEMKAKRIAELKNAMAIALMNHDWLTGSLICAELSAVIATVEQNPVPDVSHIVKLLDRARSSVDYQMSAQNQNHEAGRKHYAHFRSLLGEIDAAIDAYHNQGGDL